MIKASRSPILKLLLTGTVLALLYTPVVAQAGSPGSEGGGVGVGAGGDAGGPRPGMGADTSQPSGVVAPPQVNFPAKEGGTDAPAPGPDASGPESPTAGKPVPPGFKLPGPPPVGGTDGGDAGQQAAVPPARTAAHGPSSTWPCIQRRMPELSVGALWAGPEIDTADQSWRDDPALSALVEKLAQRRTKDDEAKAAIEAYAATLKDDKTRKLTQVFGALFQIVDAERREIVFGIERFAERQKGLADKIRQDSRQLTAVETRPDQSADDKKTIQTLRDQFEWDTRIYDSREQSLTAVCETPVLIEQRLYSLSRVIQEKLG